MALCLFLFCSPQHTFRSRRPSLFFFFICLVCCKMSQTFCSSIVSSFAKVTSIVSNDRDWHQRGMWCSVESADKMKNQSSLLRLNVGVPTGYFQLLTWPKNHNFLLSLFGLKRGTNRLITEPYARLSQSADEQCSWHNVTRESCTHFSAQITWPVGH